MAGLAEPCVFAIRYFLIRLKKERRHILDVSHLSTEGLHIPAIKFLARNADAELLCKPVVGE